MSLPTRRRVWDIQNSLSVRCFVFSLFLSLSFGVSHCNQTPARTKSVYICVTTDSKRSFRGLQSSRPKGSRRTRLLMPHHDSSSNYWLMLFSSSVLATRHCSCCREDKALLVFTEFENIHIKTSRIGKNGQEGWAAQEEQIRISFELFEISKCNLENWSTLKPINDGCVHGKKKKRANSTALTPAASMTRFSSSPAPLAHGRREMESAVCLLQIPHKPGIFTSG